MHRFYCPQLVQAAGPAASSQASGSATNTLAQPTALALPVSQGAGALVTLDDQQAHHARRVLRLKAGDRVELFDGQGCLAQGELASWQNGATLAVTSIQQVARPTLLLTLGVAMPKGPRADTMMNQLTQLGVDQVIPLNTARSERELRSTHVDRFERITIEAAKQCGRLHLLHVLPAANLSGALARAADIKLIASPDQGGKAPKLNEMNNVQHVIVLIGPEGGWTGGELEEAEAHGWERWRLGPHILRIEIAAVAAASIVKYDLNHSI